MIIDDEPLAHSVLKEYIQLNEQLELVEQCYSAEEAKTYLIDNKIDILFLYGLFSALTYFFLTTGGTTAYIIHKYLLVNQKTLTKQKLRF